MGFVLDYIELGIMSLVLARFIYGSKAAIIKYVWNLAYTLMAAFMFYQVLPHHVELTYIIICLLGVITGRYVADKPKISDTLFFDVVYHLLLILVSIAFWMVLVSLRPFLGL